MPCQNISYTLHIACSRGGLFFFATCHSLQTPKSFSLTAHTYNHMRACIITRDRHANLLYRL